MKKLIEVMPNLIINGGFFRYITTLDNSEAVPLGMAYGLMHSGDKPIAPLLQKILGTNETVTDANEQTIASILNTTFNDKWTHIKDALATVYDPLENYSMVEHGTDTEEGTDTHNITKGAETDTNTSGVGHSESTTKNKAVGDTELTAREKVETDVRQKVDTVVSGARSDSDENVKDLEKSHNLTRSGNIGVTTSQQMLQSEIDVRQYIYFEKIFKDIDKYLCLSVYE